MNVLQIWEPAMWGLTWDSHVLMTLQESALNDVAVHTLIENMGRPQGTFTATGQGLIPKLQLAMLIEVAHELFDGFFKEQGLRGWIWLGKTLIEGSSKMLVASVSSFEWYNFYIPLQLICADLCHVAVIISWTTASCEGSLTKSFDEDWVQAAEKRWVQWHYFCCGGQAHLRT